MKVIIETPYAGNVEVNKEYARLCMKHSLSRHESPFLSHLLYTQVLDDTNPSERNTGVVAGFEWGKVADKVVVYTDLGISSGMKQGIENAKRHGILIEYRKLFQNE